MCRFSIFPHTLFIWPTSEFAAYRFLTIFIAHLCIYLPNSHNLYTYYLRYMATLTS